MRLPYIILLTISLFSSQSCKKSKNTGININGSPYTKEMCGTREYHYTQTGTSNPTTHATYTIKKDVTGIISFEDEANVSLNGYNFKYDTASADSSLTYRITNPPDWHTWQYDITFNRFTNTITIDKSYYVSAGGGTTSELWVSF